MTADDTPVDARASLRESRRIVIKIGSRALTNDTWRFERLADQVAVARADGREVVVVSSGAVAMGREKLGFTSRPKQLPKLQAAAAVGQAALMRRWEEAFAPHDLTVAEVLLTHTDLSDRDRFLNARGALDAMLSLGAVPIINENDTVAVDEIRFGDNDQLAAMVAGLVGADLLFLLTDVEGVLDAAGERIPVVADVDALAEVIRPPEGDFSRGGMTSKVDAAERATQHGTPVIIGDASDHALVARAVAGDDVGTLFLPHGSPLASKKHWIAFTLKPKGALVVDVGAARALTERGASLLAKGVVGVRGSFEVGDAVSIVNPEGVEIARGLARFGVSGVAARAGHLSEEDDDKHYGEVIVHRSALVVLER